jgi:hypothetical protein
MTTTTSRVCCGGCRDSTPRGWSRCSTPPRSPRLTSANRAEARSAEGSAAELQRKTAITDGPVRFTAPSVVFEASGQRLIAGGFQPVEAYDVLIANLDPTLRRQLAPESPLLEHFGEGLTTQEVAALLAQGNDRPDKVSAEAALIELVAVGRAVRKPLGDDALWLAPGAAASLGVAA